MMPDREKVIKCLELCRKLTASCEGCPYENVPPVENCMLTMHDDALALLKEHDAVMPRVSSVDQRCGNCNKVIEMDGWKTCPWCGKPIDWARWWRENTNGVRHDGGTD